MNTKLRWFEKRLDRLRTLVLDNLTVEDSVIINGDTTFNAPIVVNDTAEFNALSTFNGNSCFNGDVAFKNLTEIGRTRYILSEDDLTANGSNTKWVLTTGTWIFDTLSGGPFILTKPFELPQSGTISIVGNSSIIYFGVGILFDQTISGQLILAIESLLLLGGDPTNPAGPSRSLFNLQGLSAIPNNQPVLIIDRAQFVFWLSIGTLDGFDVITAADFSMRFNLSGLTVKDLYNFFSIANADFSSALNFFPRYDHVSFTGIINTTWTAQISSVNFIPNAVTEFAFNILNTTTPNCAFNNNILDSKLVVGNQFFDPLGLDQTSIYVVAQGNKNIENSKVSGEMIGSDAVGTTTTVNIQNQWIKLKSVTGTVLINNERVTQGVAPDTELFIINSIETTLINLFCNVSLKLPSSTQDIEVVFGLMEPFVSTVLDNTTNTFTSIGHGFADGILLYFSATTFPTLMNQGETFYTLNTTVDTYQLEATVGLGVFNFTTNGVGIFHSHIIIEGGSSIASVGSTRFSNVISSGLAESHTNDCILLMVRNVGGIKDVITSSYYTRLIN